LKTDGQYINGQLTGLYLEHYPDGTLWKKWIFSDGKENGQSVWFFPDGKISIEWNYHNGFREGTSKWYYESGEKWAAQNYRNGKLESITYTYYKTGELQGEWNFINGILQGISKTYYKSGKVEVERNFVNGILQGETRVFHENGAVALDAFYKNNKLEGDVKILDMGGTVRVKDTYIADELVNRIRYDYKGKFENQEKTTKEFYPNGSVKEEIFIKDGKKEDFVRNYFHRKVRPRLMPIMFDQIINFPDLKDEAIYFAVSLINNKKSKQKYALIEIPSGELPRFLILPDIEDKKFIMIVTDNGKGFNEDKIIRAVLAPTPDTVIRSLKSSRSLAEKKPKKRRASSLTTW